MEKEETSHKEKESSEPTKQYLRLTVNVQGEERDLLEWLKSLPPGGKLEYKSGREEEENQ